MSLLRQSCLLLALLSFSLALTNVNEESSQSPQSLQPPVSEDDVNCPEEHASQSQRFRERLKAGRSAAASRCPDTVKRTTQNLDVATKVDVFNLPKGYLKPTVAKITKIDERSLSHDPFFATLFGAFSAAMKLYGSNFDGIQYRPEDIVDLTMNKKGAQTAAPSSAPASATPADNTSSNAAPPTTPESIATATQLAAQTAPDGSTVAEKKCSEFFNDDVCPKGQKRITTPDTVSCAPAACSTKCCTAIAPGETQCYTAECPTDKSVRIGAKLDFVCTQNCADCCKTVVPNTCGAFRAKQTSSSFCPAKYVLDIQSNDDDGCKDEVQCVQFCCNPVGATPPPTHPTPENLNTPVTSCQELWTQNQDACPLNWLKSSAAGTTTCEGAQCTSQCCNTPKDSEMCKALQCPTTLRDGLEKYRCPDKPPRRCKDICCK